MSEPTLKQLFDLSGRVALITGGSGHLGSSLSRVLAEAGATVVVGSRDQSRATRVADELPSLTGVSHCGVELDQLDEESLIAGFGAAVAPGFLVASPAPG